MLPNLPQTHRAHSYGHGAPVTLSTLQTPQTRLARATRAPYASGKPTWRSSA